MKIPFTLEAWLKNKSQKVETRDGRPVRIVCTDAKAHDGACIIALIPGYGGEEAYQFFPTGILAFSSKSSNEDCAEDYAEDLFLITPEPELSEFEERIFKLLRQYKECDIPLTPENIKAEASMLWSDFEKYFFDLYGKEGEGDSALRSFYYRGREDGKAEVLKDLPRWRRWEDGVFGDLDGHPIALVAGCGGIRFVSCLDAIGEKYIMLSDLKKLPGFKED